MMEIQKIKRPYVNLESENTIESLLNLSPKDMYSWMYQIADEVREVYK